MDGESTFEKYVFFFFFFFLKDLYEILTTEYMYLRKYVYTYIYLRIYYEFKTKCTGTYVDK